MRDWPADLVEIPSPQLSRLRHLDEQLCAQGISELREKGSPARPHHPAFTYHGWLWDTRRGPRTPLARSVLSWSDATASLPNFRARGGRAARRSSCADEPGSARVAWSGSSRTGSGTRVGLSWLAGAARPPGTCRSVRCGRPCSLPLVSDWRHRRGLRPSDRSWGRWFLSGLASMPGVLTAG